MSMILVLLTLDFFLPDFLSTLSFYFLSFMRDCDNGVVCGLNKDLMPDPMVALAGEWLLKGLPGDRIENRLF